MERPDTTAALDKRPDGPPGTRIADERKGTALRPFFPCTPRDGDYISQCSMVCPAVPALGVSSLDLGRRHSPAAPFLAPRVSEALRSCSDRAWTGVPSNE